jgi:DNA-directed RNA polymerase subunit RPC12/RpoP
MEVYPANTYTYSPVGNHLDFTNVRGDHMERIIDRLYSSAMYIETGRPPVASTHKKEDIACPRCKCMLYTQYSSKHPDTITLHIIDGVIISGITYTKYKCYGCSQEWHYMRLPPDNRVYQDATGRYYVTLTSDENVMATWKHTFVYNGTIDVAGRTDKDIYALPTKKEEKSPPQSPVNICNFISKLWRKLFRS